MGSLCRGISLKKIPVYLPRLRSMSHSGPLWWHHIVVEAFPLGRLADLCLHDTTPSLHPHAAHMLANTYLLLSTGNFSRGLWSIHSFSLNTLTLFSCLLCISHGGLQVAVTFWTVRVTEFEATCNFLLWDTDTSCIFPIFLLCTSSLLSKSRLEPVKGLMRLEFIRQWDGTAPCSPLTAYCWLLTLILRKQNTCYFVK